MPYDVNHVLKHADVAGWALGALDPIDAQALEAHLRSCGQCQAAVAEFEPVAKALSRAAPAVEPPDNLQARTIASVLAAVAEDKDAAKIRPIPVAFRPAGPRPSQALPVPPGPDSDSDSDSDSGEPGPGRRPGAGGTIIRFPRWHGHARLAAVAGAIAGAVAAAIIAVLVIAPGSGHGLPAGAVKFNLAPASGQTASATATDVQDASGSWRITMNVQHLAVLTGEDYYECWYVRPARAGRPEQYVSAGTFVVPDNGSWIFSMSSGVDPTEFSRMEIHKESPGATSPQGPAILSGTAVT